MKVISALAVALPVSTTAEALWSAVQVRHSPISEQDMSLGSNISKSAFARSATVADRSLRSLSTNTAHAEH